MLLLLSRGVLFLEISILFFFATGYLFSNPAGKNTDFDPWAKHCSTLPAKSYALPLLGRERLLYLSPGGQNSQEYSWQFHNIRKPESAWSSSVSLFPFSAGSLTLTWGHEVGKTSANMTWPWYITPIPSLLYRGASNYKEFLLGCYYNSPKPTKSY